MKKVSLGLVLLVLIAMPLFAGSTYVSGVISSNAVWDTTGSPYIVSGNILVDVGVILTIQPGVEVRLDSSKYIRTKGSLFAIGTATDSIIFTKNKNYGWNMLEFQSALNAVFKYCRIEYAENSAIRGGADSLYVGYSNISNNCGYNGGSGIFVDTNCIKAIITNSIISNNSGSNGGGGIYVFADSAFINDNMICNNRTNWSPWSIGGGILNRVKSFAMISNNIISNNIATGSGGGGRGGGIFNYTSNSAVTTISHNIITFNKASNGRGGGICNDLYGSMVVTNNIISNNTADGGDGAGGGGIYMRGVSDTITNNMICDNTSLKFGGGGIFVDGDEGPITHNTIANNFAFNSNPYFGSVTFLGGGENNFTSNTIIDTFHSAIGTSYSNTPILRHNNIFAKKYALNNSGTPNFYADSNWWGTTDTNKIDSLVYDYTDDFNFGRVYYKPFLFTADTNAPPPPPFNVTVDSSGIGEIIISWDSVKVADLAGYKVWYDTDTLGFFYEGTGASEGNSPIDVGNVNSFKLTGLIAPFYYIAVTTYDNSGDSSWFSEGKRKLKKHIAGTVTDSKTGNPIFCTVIAFKNDSESYATTTDTAGKYTINGLDSVKHFICAWTDGYIGEFYDTALSWESATEVAPNADDIDFALAPASKDGKAGISGEISSNKSAPLGDVMVYAINIGNVIGCAKTAPNGRYIIDKLPAGSYIIRASIPFCNTTDYSSSITLSEDTVSNININMNKIGIESKTIDTKTYLTLKSPNPAIGKVAISYSIPLKTQITLEIYDATGRLLRTLVNAQQNANSYAVNWNGTDNSGRRIPSGMYFCQLKAGEFKLVKKIVFIR